MDAKTAADLKLIERIKKLHAMAEGAKAVGSLAEAESFMEAMNKTLAKHNLDVSVLSTDIRDLRDPLGYCAEWGSLRRHRDKPVRWAQWLAGAVAKAHYCDTLVAVDSSLVFFYGRKSNYEVAARMFVYLRDLAEKLGWREYQRECKAIREFRSPRKQMNKWYLDYLEGFAIEVGKRYDAMRARVESDRGMSLVLVSVRDEATKYANSKAARAEDLKDKHKDAPTGVGYYEAHMKGRKDAQSANLRPTDLTGDESDEPKLIGC